MVDFLFCFDKDQRDGDNVVPEIYSFQLNTFWKKKIIFCWFVCEIKGYEKERKVIKK